MAVLLFQPPCYPPIGLSIRTDRSAAVLERAGRNALFAADEFFDARISNLHSRRAPARVVTCFLAWCEQEHLVLSQVSPGLAALRQFFDTLLTRHAAPLNPFQSVRGRMHGTSDGKTHGLPIQQARDLLGSIDISHVVGLRDRYLLEALAYTGARIGAIARLRRGDLEDQGTQRSVPSPNLGPTLE